MELFNIELSSLQEYENNPRNNDSAVDAVAASIREFGFKIPIVIDRDNVIIAGHTRVKAARQLGMESVPCIIADDLTPQQVKAFRLADNKVAELAGWNWSKLEEELADISINMEQFGFDMSEDVDIDSFFEEQEESGEKEPKRIQCPHCGEWFEV